MKEIFKDLFKGMDLIDIAIVVLVFYLVVTGTLGLIDKSMVEPVVKWIGLIIAFFLGKKTPNTLGK